MNSTDGHKRKRMTCQREHVLKHGPRVCLSCDEAFPSSGPWNRFCPACARENRSCSRERSRGSALSAADVPNEGLARLQLEVEGASAWWAE